PANRFEVALVAFVLFHLPSPEQCLAELNRVLRPGGSVGTVTWGSEKEPAASAIWDDELQAAGAQVIQLPAVDNRACCDSTPKMTTLLEQADSSRSRYGPSRLSIDGDRKTTSTISCA